MPPSPTDAILDATAVDIVRALADRDVSARELAAAAIARIEARDGPINAVVVRDFDRALTAAGDADAALARGERRALLGVPMTVKEAHNVAGLPTTWGFPDFNGMAAPEDSVGVQRLKAAGAIILGKTNVPTALADWQSINPIYGRTNNPWDLSRSPGGSSGGSAAALAAGMVPLEFGSDIGGSIRIPAAFCGVCGHKPSYNLVPQRGHAPRGADGVGVPLGVVGPLARSVGDLELLLDVLAGPDEAESVGYRLGLRPARHQRLCDFRVLIVDAHPLAAAESEIVEALSGLGDRLSALGASVARHTALLPDLAAAHGIYLAMLNAIMSRGAPPAPHPMSAHAWMGLLDAQDEVRRRWATLFQDFDVVLAPTLGTVAFAHVAPVNPGTSTLTINGAATPYFSQLAWPGMATLANLPATALPIARSRDGLPIGAQIIGPYLEDRTALGFAGLVEREFGGFTAPPNHA